MQLVRRSLSHADVRALTEQVQAYYRHLYGGQGDDAPMDGAEFEPPQGEFWVGYLDDAPVAMGAWRRRTLTGVPGPVAELKRMFVSARAQGRGLGAAMLTHLEDRARDAGVRSVVLQTGVLQQAAHGLYTAHGYQPLPAGLRFDWDPHGGDDFVHRLWRDLATS